MHNRIVESCSNNLMPSSKAGKENANSRSRLLLWLPHWCQVDIGRLDAVLTVIPRLGTIVYYLYKHKSFHSMGRVAALIRVGSSALQCCR